MMFKEKLGASLKRFRENFKLNQRDVSRAIGIPYQSYQAYEYGKSVPSAEVIFKIANAYDVSTDYLLGRSDMPRPMNFDEREVREAFAIRDAQLALQQATAKARASTGQMLAQ